MVKMYYAAFGLVRSLIILILLHFLSMCMRCTHLIEKCVLSRVRFDY